MRLDELTLTNFCQHTGTFKFSPFLTGIIGGNGTGKSNIMAAIRLLMTGENQNAGTLDMNINQAAPRNARCNIKGTFVDGDTTYRVTRHLRPAGDKTTLEILRDSAVIDTLIGDAKVTTWMREVAGASPETLTEYVLVSQGDIYSFLDQQPAKRAASFQRLFHLQPIERAFDVVHKRIVKTVVPTIAGDRDAELSRVTEAQDALIRIDAALASLPDTSNYEDRLMALQTSIDDVNRQTSWQTEKARAQKEANEVATLRTLLSAEIMTDEANLAKVEEGLAEFKKPAEDGRVTLATWTQRQQLESSRTALQTQRDSAAAALDSLAPPDASLEMVPAGGIEAAEARKQELYSLVSQAQRLVKTFKNTGLVNCPTCDTPVATLKDKVAQAEKNLPIWDVEAMDLQKRVGNTHAYGRDMSAYTVHHDAATNLLKRLDEQLVILTPADETELTSKDQCQYAIDQYAQHEQAINAFTPELQIKRERLSGMHSKYEAAVKAVANADVALTDITADPTAAAEAPAKQHELRTAKGSKDTLEFDRRTADTQRLNARAAIDRLDAQLPHIQQIENYLGHLQKLEGLLHRDGLAKFVTHNRLQQLQIGVNQMLELFGVEFRVAANEALSFTATFLDGTVTPATRLSGGQQVVLAIAFRASVNSMFAGEVGMLMLDEPTVYLDREHIGRFTVVLQRLRELSASKGLQIILITHEEELAPLFDEVISL